MKQSITVLCSLLFLLFTGASFNSKMEAVQAQNGLTPIYSGRDLSNFYWSPDSSTLIFQERSAEAGVGVVLESDDYFSFDISNQILSQTSIWPLQPVLSPLEKQIYLPYTNASRNEEDFIFASPNQRYLLYVAAPDRTLALADRQTEAAKIFDVLAGKTTETDFFFTLWSANSESVVVGNNPILGDVPRYFYISDFASDLQQATIQEIYFDVTLNDREYGTGFVEDISQDGQTLLISALDLASLSSGSRSRLYLAAYTFSNPPEFKLYENTSMHEQNILDVAFNLNYLLALTQEGIQRYNTLTNTWSMVNADVNATWVDYAQISPDGRYIVVQDNHNHGFSDVYVIDLRAILPAPTSYFYSNGAGN